MKRGHVPRLAAQMANFGLLLLIVGVCGFVAWRASQYKAFVVPEGYIAGFVEQGGFFWEKDWVRVFSAGVHPVLQNEEAASSPAYRVGAQSFVFDAAAKVNVAIWKDAKNLLTRGQAPRFRVRGEIEASVTKETVQALLLSNEPIDYAMKKSVAQVLAKSAKENASGKEALETALLDGLEERLAERIHLKVHRIQIDEVSEVDSTTPTTIDLPSDFVIQTEIVNKTPPAAYASVGLAVLVGSLAFLLMRLLFADLIALVILTPFQWVGIVETVHWRVPEEKEKVEEGQSVAPDLLSGFPSPSESKGSPPPPEPGPVAGPTIDAAPVPDVSGVLAEGINVGVEVPGELASGAAEAAGGLAGGLAEGAAEAVGGLAGGLAEGAAEAFGGCLGGIFG